MTTNERTPAANDGPSPGRAASPATDAGDDSLGASGDRSADDVGEESLDDAGASSLDGVDGVPRVDANDTSEEALLATTDDPRLDPEYVRRCRGDGAGDVVLVGVVHDHPASRSRVGSVIAEVEPTVLALELAPLAVPLFEAYAHTDATPPRFGGEMSAAVQAASTDRIEGIDGPSPGFLARLCRQLVAQGASRSTVRKTVERLASSAKRASICRAAAVVASRTSLRIEADSPVDHECSLRDDPQQQADDERRQVRRATAVLNALEPPAASRVCDAARERHMASRLASLRTSGDVVAVVGFGHLESVAQRLEQ